MRRLLLVRLVGVSVQSASGGLRPVMIVMSLRLLGGRLVARLEVRLVAVGSEVVVRGRRVEVRKRVRLVGDCNQL